MTLIDAEAPLFESEFPMDLNLNDNSSNIEKDMDNNMLATVLLHANNTTSSTVLIPRARTSSIENIQLKDEIKIDKEMLSSSNKNQRIALGPQHFDLLKLVGEGAFGKVIMVKNIVDDNLYAMKIITKKLLKKKNHILYMKSERDILTKIKHPFIVALQFAFQTDSKLFLVMDFLSGGELFFHLKRRGLIMENEAKFYFAEMILAIDYLHSMGVIHRDLKPENVLLRAEGHICLTDFGLAKEIGDGQKVRTLCGTSEYMAPEMLARNGYGKGVDWWSLGALFFEMLTGSPPFTSKNAKELDKKIMTENFNSPSYLTANAHSLLKGLLEKDVNKRLGATKATMFKVGGISALKQHPFFDDLDWHAIAKLEVKPPIDLQKIASVLGSPSDPTIHFHEGFTTQNISPSVIEESLSGVSSPARSRTNSKEYEGFEFFGKDFNCSEEKLIEVEKLIVLKLAKANKKKLFREKTEKNRIEKAAIEDSSKKAKLIIEENERLNKETMRLLEEKERERLIYEQNLKMEKQKKKEENLLELEKHQLIIDIHKEKIDKILKKIKNLKKKLRDILDLQAKVEMSGIKITNEQKDKLDRKQEIEDEIAEFNEELDILESSTPPPIPDYLLVLDADIITDISLVPIEVNNNHIDSLVNNDHIDTLVNNYHKDNFVPITDTTTLSTAITELKIKDVEEKKIVVDSREFSFQGAAERGKIYELRKQKEENRITRDKLQRNIDKYKENVEKISKKIKNLKKKLRDILDIKVKVDLNLINLTNEQKDKLDRKQEIEDEIAEFNEELDILESSKPPPIPDYLLVLDADIITDISLVPIEVKKEVILTFADRLRLQNNPINSINSLSKINSNSSNSVYQPPLSIYTKSNNESIDSSRDTPVINKNIPTLLPSCNDDDWESVSMGKKKTKNRSNI